MLRSLHLINTLGAGGAERSLAELLPDLRRRGFDPVVAVLKRTTEGVEDQIIGAGIDLHHIGVSSWHGRIAQVRRLVKQLRPDIIHTTLFESDVIGRLASVGTGVPVLTTLASPPYAPVRFQDPNLRVSRLRAAQLLDLASAHIARSHFHAVSEAVRETAVATLRLPPDRITVIPRGRRRSRLGEPSEARRSAVRARLGIPTSAVVLLHVGREDFAKGLDILFDAVSELLNQRPDLYLVTAGRRGGASDAVDQRLSSLPMDRLLRLGFVEGVPDLLAAADVFVFPSRYEGMAGSVIEAMAMEVPVLTTDLPAMRELLGEHGHFIAGPTAGELQTRLLEVLGDLPTARTRAAGSRVVFEDTYQHDQVVEAMGTLLREVASGTRAGRGRRALESHLGAKPRIRP